MTFNFSAKTADGDHSFSLEPGETILFVGANGGGKTRLAVSIEEQLGANAHRISAHRALSLNPSVAKISEEEALNGLRIGYVDRAGSLGNRIGSRWGSKAAVYLLNDYDHLVQALFADQSNVSLQTHKAARRGDLSAPVRTKFERLQEIWRRIFPHRALEITGDDIFASTPNSADRYRASDMSDGERAAFYLIGQTLAAAENSLIIFDEPELHVHRSIMSRLWDELEAARPDCGFVLITHDLEFAASRDGQKLVLRAYDPTTGWIIEDVPEDSGFPEEIATLILGSRKPILFVEGTGSSLDLAIYRACYPGWTVLPRGSCEAVIHSVTTMRANSQLTRVTCSGIVDADAYDEAEAATLSSKGIGVLPVSEIENLFLLPEVSRAIAEDDGFSGPELDSKVEEIAQKLFVFANDQAKQTKISLRYARRRIDRALKKVDLSEAETVGDLTQAYSTATGQLDVDEIFEIAKGAIEKAIEDRNAPELLRWFDHKGLMSIACLAKNTKAPIFEQWVVRAMRNGTSPKLGDAIQAVIPQVQAS